MRLDPARLAPEKLPRHEVGAGRWFILSLLLHSLPVLSLVGWRATPAEMPDPIPVQLVIEQPPPTPVPAAPKPAPDPPHLPLASDDFGPVAAAETRPGVTDPAPAVGGPEPPLEAKTAAPEPARLPELVPPKERSGVPMPPSTPEIEMAALMPPPPPKRPPHKQSAAPEMSLPMNSGWPLPLHQNDAHPPQRLASLIGPPAVRDEYCARALNLTLRHLDQLPLSSLAGRRGRTVVSIRILGDGTINSVSIAQSSGYPDIDQRVQKMVFAVGQYPPLPPRIPGTSADFTFAMVFPDPRQR